MEDILPLEPGLKGRSLLGLQSETEGVVGLALPVLLSCLVLNREGASETTLALPVLLFCLVLNREGVSETTLSAAGLPARTGSAELSRDMPGRPLRPENTSSPPFVSSLLLLYAAFPTPLSAVWRKYDGSRAPSDAAIWSRES